jgi:cell division septation protein DedD
MGGDAGGKPPPEKLLPPPEQPLPKPVVPPEPAPVAAAAPAPAAPVAPPVPAATAPTPAPARPVAATPPAVSPVPPPAAPAAAGGWRVQIAATKDEASAHSEWARLQKAHPELLGALGLNVIRADLGERGVFYRIQAGPVADAAQAQKLCGDLKAVSVGCIVVKP